MARTAFSLVNLINSSLSTRMIRTDLAPRLEHFFHSSILFQREVRIASHRLLHQHHIQTFRSSSNSIHYGFFQLISNSMNSNPVNNGNLGLHATIVPNAVTRTLSNISSTPISVNLISNVPTSGNGTTTTSSRLKVEDALSYLDRVKNQFALQPQVYNQFLDIMKEFKSQSIDTQEVINRVSTLFHGHPDLIVGFNTFLPPGYKIEVSDDHEGFIHVTHPSSRIESIAIGTIPTNGNGTYTFTTTNLRSTSNLFHSDHDDSSISQHSTSQAMNTLISAANATPHQSNSKSSKNSTNNVTTTTTTTTTNNGQPVEFNHAINYVNKIKIRFHQNPAIYKTFLEILHTYQKQQRDGKDVSTGATNGGDGSPTVFLSEGEVYAKVAQLFANHEDLLAEFRQFLPDASQQSTEKIHSISAILSSSENSNSPTRFIVSNPLSSSFLTVTNLNSSTSVASSSPSFTILSSTTPMIKDEISHHPLSPKKSTTTTPIGTQSKRSISTSKNSVMPKKQRVTVNDTTGQNPQYPSIDEMMFFDQVRKTLRSPAVFDNFLRCILLYTKQIVSRVELFNLIQSYLSHAPELLKTFQELIHLREPGEVIIPKSIYDQNDSDSMISIDYASCAQFGKSYRSVPGSYVPPICSGRTQLCREVLNDECVLFPTFTDESSSVATKKSIYEENMYKIEDERFELDIVMEVNLSAIRALENVQTQMQSMTVEQLNNFQLDDQLGGHSAFTQRQAVQRIYGERATEIIDGLKRSPRVAVPIVLRRLKSKDEEWRESKKNFERFWREQCEKYYLKSLDYMGINCKNTDARLIRNRHLLNEIETIKRERDQQLNNNETQPHLLYLYEDLSIIDDATSLIIFLVKRQSTFSRDDKQKMKKFLCQFLTNFLFTPQIDLSDDEEGEDDQDENENHSKREKKSRSTRHSDPNRRRPVESSTIKPKQLPEEYQTSNDMFHLIFVNDNFYYFFRLHQFLCERLTKVYQQSLKLIEQENPNQRSRTAPPRLVNRSNVAVDEYYSSFLDMLRNLLDNTTDNSTYEDSLRDMFGIQAYIAFTMDKILHNCVKQLHAIVTDQASDELMRLYSRSNGTTGFVDEFHSVSQQNSEASYQHEAEAFAHENRLYRICSFKNERRIGISLIQIESSDDEEENDEEKENIVENGTDYAHAYLHTNDGELSEESSVTLRTKLKDQPRFLMRNLLPTNDIDDTYKSKLITIDNDSCSLNTKSFKRTPIHRAGFSQYKSGSFRSIRQRHQTLTMKQCERFTKFHQDWIEKNVSETEMIDPLMTCWMKSHRFHPNDQQHFTIEVQMSDNPRDLTEPPYHHYRQYRLVDIEK